MLAMSTLASSSEFDRKDASVSLIPRLPNEIWRMIVLSLYFSLPEEYREHTVHILRSVSCGWRDGVEGMSVLWTLITYGTARAFPSGGLRAAPRSIRDVVLPNYLGSTTISGEGEGESGEVDMHDHELAAETEGEGEALLRPPSTPTSEFPIRGSWTALTLQQKRAIKRFDRSIFRSGRREVYIKITLRKTEGVPLGFLTRQFLDHVSRVAVLDVDVPRTRGHERPHELAVLFGEESKMHWTPQECASESAHPYGAIRVMNCAGLTTLKLSNVCFLEVGHAAILLHNCPALVNLTVSCNTHWSQRPSEQLRYHAPLVLPQLEQLTTEMAFLINLWTDGIDTPKLVQLCLTNPCWVNVDHSVTQPPSYAWMSKLETLGLSGAFTDESIERYLLHTPVLQKLGLQHCGTPGLCRDVFTRTTSSYPGLGESVIAPRLGYVRFVHALIDDASVLTVLERRPCNPDGLPKPLMFDLRSCSFTTVELGMVLIKRGRGRMVP